MRKIGIHMIQFGWSLGGLLNQQQRLYWKISILYIIIYTSIFWWWFQHRNSCRHRQKMDPSSCLLSPSVACIIVVQIQDAYAASDAAITPLWPWQSLLWPPPPFADIASRCTLTLVVANHCLPLLLPWIVGCYVLPCSVVSCPLSCPPLPSLTCLSPAAAPSSF